MVVVGSRHRVEEDAHGHDRAEAEAVVEEDGPGCWRLRSQGKESTRGEAEMSEWT